MTEKKGELTPVKKAEIQLSEKDLKDYLLGSGTSLTDSQFKMFCQVAKSCNLNPFKREIYAVPFKNYRANLSDIKIVVGYEVYLRRAELSGRLNGWRVWTEGDGRALKACVEIHRKDWQNPFRHEVFASEYNSGAGLWSMKPLTMIKKVAIAQAFRLCFPEDIDGLPYISEEIEQPKDVNNYSEKKIPEFLPEKKETENPAQGLTTPVSEIPNFETEQKSEKKPVSSIPTKKSDDDLRNEVTSMLEIVYSGDADKIGEAIKKFSAFKNKAGKKFFVTTIKELNGKWLAITHKKIVEQYKQWEKENNNSEIPKGEKYD